MRKFDASTNDKKPHTIGLLRNVMHEAQELHINLNLISIVSKNLRIYIEEGGSNTYNVCSIMINDGDGDEDICLCDTDPENNFIIDLHNLWVMSMSIKAVKTHSRAISELVDDMIKLIKKEIDSKLSDRELFIGMFLSWQR